MAAYAAALAGLPDAAIGASRTVPGTINALVVNYYGSATGRSSRPTLRRTAAA